MAPSLWKIIDTYEERLLRDPRSAREELSLLFKGFLREERVFDALVIWTLLVKAIIFSWDDFRLLDEYLCWARENSLLKEFSHLPDLRAATLGAYFGGLLFRQPESPELFLLEERLFRLVRICEKESVRLDGLFFLAIYAFWQGDIQRLHRIIDELTRGYEPGTPAGLLLTLWIRAGRDIWIHADLPSAERYLNRAHRLAREQEIGLWDHIIYSMKIACALLQSRFREARKDLSRMENELPKTGRHGRFHFFYLSGWTSFLEGDFNAAELAMQRALEIAQETGYWYAYYLSHFALAEILFRKGHVVESLARLDRCEDFARRMRSRILFFMCLLFRARMAYLSGDQTFGRFFLSRALSIGNRENYFQFLWWSDPQMMAYLCARALEEGIEKDYVRRFILKHRLKPPQGGPPPRDWPYPVRIHTLGGLEILVQGKPLDWPRRSPERPLALLLALVTAGGSLDRERLMDFFWPDLEADSAYHALESTLYRLRKLLGLREAVVSQGRCLRLEKDLVFVDLWYFKDLLERLERESSSGNLLRAYFLLQEVLEMYGDFLPGVEYPFVIFEREALKSRLFWLLKSLAPRLAREFSEQARHILERIWLLDPTREELFWPLFEFLVSESVEDALDLFHRFETLLRAKGKKVSRTLAKAVERIKEKAALLEKSL